MKNLLSILLIGLFSANVVVAQTPPTVDDPPTILGSAYVHKYNPSSKDESTKLTASYVYNGDNAEGASQINWYRVSGGGSLGTDIRYTLTRDDIGEEIYFTIRPMDVSTNLGSTYTSDPITVSETTTISDVQKSNETDNSGGSLEYLNLEIKQNTYYTIENGTTVHIYGDLTKENGVVGQVTFNIWDSSTVILHGQFIAQDQMVINVSPNSTFTIVSGIDARNDAVLDISGSLAVSGDITVENNATFSIADGGTLDVNGDVSLGESGAVTIEGAMSIGGDLDTGSGVDPNNTVITVVDPGTIDVTGDLVGTAAIAGDGTIYVGGDVGGGIEDTSGAGDSGSQINNTPLPIELSSFWAFVENGMVNIQWETATEENNDFFSIERSENGVDFEIIAYIPGAGNSLARLDYSYTDSEPLEGISYYRLKQTDYNGDNETFDMVSVTNNIQNILNQDLTLLLENGQLNIDFKQDLNNIEFGIYDIVGRRVLNDSYYSTNKMKLNVNHLPKGVYVITLYNNNSFNFSEKFQIQ